MYLNVTFSFGADICQSVMNICYKPIVKLNIMIFAGGAAHQNSIFGF